MPYQPPPSLSDLSLADIAALAATDQLLPVATWQPAICGHSAMRIAADGRWYHDGGEIRRPTMVRAFSRLLRREADGSHWLVTPAERLAIDVEDAPLLAVEQQVEGTGMDAARAFRLNNDRLVIVDSGHPLVWAAGTAMLPYLRLEGSLLARPSRPLWGALADEALALVEAGIATAPGVWSNSAFFAFESAPL